MCVNVCVFLEEPTFFSHIDAFRGEEKKNTILSQVKFYSFKKLSIIIVTSHIVIIFL